MGLPDDDFASTSRDDTKPIRKMFSIYEPFYNSYISLASYIVRQELSNWYSLAHSTAGYINAPFLQEFCAF